MLITDENELIVTVNQLGEKDGGDQASNEWWYWFWYQLMAVNKLYITMDRSILLQVVRKISFYDVILQLEPREDGVFRRSWRAPWSDYQNPKWVFTRDQTIGLVICSGFNNKIFWRVTFAHLRRLWFCQSGEPYHMFLFTWLRCLAIQYEWTQLPTLLLLVFFDIPIWFMVLERCGYIPHFDQDAWDEFREHADSLDIYLRVTTYLFLPLMVTKFFRKIQMDDVGDDKNLILCLYQLGPETFVRRYAREFYFRNRPSSSGLGEGYIGGRVGGAIRWYFRGPNKDGSNGNPDLADFGITLMNAQDEQWAKQ